MARTSLISSQNKDVKKKTSTPQKKGFAAMSPEKVEEIALKGGSARAAQLGRAGYVALGQLGGLARAKQLGKTGYGEMGRKGAKARAEQAKLRNQASENTTSSNANASGTKTHNSTQSTSPQKKKAFS